MMIKPEKGIGPLAIVIVLASLVTTPLFAAEKSADADISYWVNDSLRIDPRVDASKIHVISKQGIVTLSGDVNNLAAKHYADLEAKKINGVLGVINNITVTPVPRLDTDIQRAVKRRILGSTSITSKGIQVISRNGRVTLTGEVTDWGEVQQAGLLASEVLGVRHVTNDLVVIWQATRTDKAIKKDAIAALQRDVYLNGLPIRVAVKDGTIILTGSVGSAFESDRATQKVHRIANVRGVMSSLKIKGRENRDAHKKTVWASDKALKRAIKDELDQDPRVAAAGITVYAGFGAITLDGKVNSYYQKRIAAQDAYNVVGVINVNNNLLVTASTRSDRKIQEDIKFNFGMDYALQDFHLKSKVKGGVVTLTGDVYNWFQKYHAEELAADVSGVRRVINRIAVDKLRPKNDQALAKDVINGLKWNWTTWPVRDDIIVTVSNGIATLKGDVNTWSERREADHVALRTAGIWAVNNQLTVNGYDYQWGAWRNKGIPDQYDPYYSPGYVPFYNDYPYCWDNC